MHKGCFCFSETREALPPYFYVARVKSLRSPRGVAPLSAAPAHGYVQFDVDDISVAADSSWRGVAEEYVEKLMAMIKRGEFGNTVSTYMQLRCSIKENVGSVDGTCGSRW